MGTIRTRNEKKADDIAEALRQDNIELQTSGRIMAENLEILRGKLAEINQLAYELKSEAESIGITEASFPKFQKIITLAEPIES